MALDPANYIDELSITDPTATDLVSQGDDQIRTVKRAVKQSFPSVDIAVNAIHTSATEPAVSVAEGLVWIDTSAGAGNHVAKIYDGSAFIVLPFSVETAQTVDINGGTIDGTVIGGATPAAISGTTLDGSTSLVLATGATVTGIDNATVDTGSATLLATQGAIKTYVDAQVTAQDLDITTDSGSIDIDLDSESLTVSGGASLDTSATGTTVTVNVTDAGVTNAKLADMAANTVKVRNANSSGVPSDVALATTEILIGDGTGFTAAALSGDATMTNAGAVTVAKLQGYDVSSTAPTNDYVLKYSTGTSKWEPAAFAYPDKLTTKGDLLAYNSVSSETRFAISGATNGDVLTADSTATNGFDWAAQTDTTYTAGDGLELTGASFSTDLLSNGGLEIQSAELSVSQGISQYDVAQFATGVVDNDFLKIATTSVEGRSAAEVLSDIAALPLAGGTMSGETIFADQLATKPKMKDYSEAINAIGSVSAAFDIDLEDGNVQSVTVTSGTFNVGITNALASNSNSLTIIGTNLGTGTITWKSGAHDGGGNTIKWPAGTAPTLTASGTDILTFTTFDGGTQWYGFAAGLAMA